MGMDTSTAGCTPPQTETRSNLHRIKATSTPEVRRSPLCYTVVWYRNGPKLPSPWYLPRLKLYATHSNIVIFNNEVSFAFRSLEMASAVSFVGDAGMYAWTGKSRTKRPKVTAMVWGGTWTSIVEDGDKKGKSSGKTPRASEG